MTAAITIHFRKPELTKHCIESLLTDGWAPILVWDNSDDGGRSLEILQRNFADEQPIIWLRSPINVGFGKGMNGALSALGRHNYQGAVLLINNDVRVKPGMRLALESELKNNSSLVLVAPRIIQHGIEQGWLFYQPWLALVTRRPLPGSFSYLSGCCLLVNRIDNSERLYDEDFFMYGEDVELSWRIRRQGGGLHLLDQIWLDHEGSASSGQASESYERFLVHSHKILARKLTANILTYSFMLALRIPSLLSRALIRSIRFKSLSPLRALTSLL